MIKDKTIDQALIEIMRTKKALEALREARKNHRTLDPCLDYPPMPAAAAAERAALDCRLKLADLRAGR